MVIGKENFFFEFDVERVKRYNLSLGMLDFILYVIRELFIGLGFKNFVCDFLIRCKYYV